MRKNGTFVRLNSPKATHGIPHVPSITILPSGKFRVQVYVAGVRDSKSFRTKREAQAWGAARETELRAMRGKAPGEKHTLGELLDLFSDKVAPGRNGGRWEQIRIAAMSRTLPVTMLVGSVGSDAVQTYRDERLASVKPGTVLREIGLLSSIFTYAKDELRWIEANPVGEAKKPPRPDHRRIVYHHAQINALLREMGYSPKREIRSISLAVAVAFMFALRTGLRAGELCGLRWSEVKKDSCHVSSKTPAGNRDVPLTRKALRLLDKMRGYDPVFVFGVKSQSLDAMFRKFRDRAGVVDHTFHDSRHTAATWMVTNGAINVLELCKIFGWTDPKMAMVYFQPSIKDMKRRLETRR